MGRKTFPEHAFLSSFPPHSGLSIAQGLPWWHPAALIATVGGIGRLRPAPGTWGSLMAIPPAWMLSTIFGAGGLAVALPMIVIAGIWASEIYVRRTGRPDPSAIVIDEVAGQWLTLIALPADPLAYTLGFVLFRAFDIFKPWPISWVDRKIGGGIGVVADDLLAGSMAGVVGWLLWDKLVAYGVIERVS